MFSLLRNRFGIPGVISVIALVFAMFGGAYAASDNSGGGKATASAKGKPGPRGPRGKTGPAGPAGPAGAQGAAGANGKDGSNGTDGAPGKDGEDGVSAEGTSFGPTEEPLSEPCEENGGVEFQSAGPDTYACNGEEGSPWTVGGTLPSEETETGAWFANGTGATGATTAISFPIPLASALPGTSVRVITTSSTAAEKEKCDDGVGTAGSTSNPEADPGFLCVFVGPAEYVPGLVYDPATSFEEGAGKTGAVLLFFSGEAAGSGTFAVTAP